MRSRTSFSIERPRASGSTTMSSSQGHIQHLQHLPTPPPSFVEEGDSPPPMEGWKEEYRLSSGPSSARGSTADLLSHHRMSLSPEPRSLRATPEREDGEEEERRRQSSRSNSPEATMRLSPLRNATDHCMNSAPNTNFPAPRANPTTGTQSVMSAYDMLTSYSPRENGISAMPRKRPNQQVFQPNAGLSKAITPSFIRDYNSARTPPLLRSEEFHRQKKLREISPTHEDNVGERFDEEEGEEGQDTYMGSLIMSNDGTATSQSGDIVRMSELSRQRHAMGWNYAPIPDRRTSYEREIPSSSASSLTKEEREKEESLSEVYYNEFSSQLDTFARKLKKPVVTFVLVMILPILLSLGTSIIMGSRQGAGGSTSSSSTNATFGGSIDFPTLMSIESSFERVVDSAAGGSELARSLKQSEMAVADLSTVVKYSDLKCRESLSSRLEQFAVDARDNVIELLEFSARVGGVLDELLSVNQYAYRELSALQSQSAEGNIMSPGSIVHRLPLPWPLSSALLAIFPSPSTIARARLAQTFDTAVEVLENNLRLLIAHGQIIQSGLMGLSQQNGPIRTEIVREFADIRRSEAEAMSSLWARISSRSGQRKNFQNNERLLKEINVYHDKARGYVEVTLLELGRMTSELDNLRRRVAQPLLVGGEKKEVELEVQVKAVGDSVDALVRKRNDRDDRQRLWNRIILEGRIMKGSELEGTVEGPRF